MKLFSNSGKRDVTQKTAQNETDTNTGSSPMEIAYPEVEWSEEQKRALQMATQSSVGDDAPISEEAAKQSFEHLAPPKKSVAKIILLILLITILVSGAAFGGWYYWWTTYATFEYELQPVVILNGQNVTSGEFLTLKAREEGIRAAFLNSEFAPVPGRVSVPLTLEFGWRSLEATATLYVMVPVTQTTHEFKVEAPAINPFDLISNAEIARGLDYTVIFINDPLPLADYEVGEYILHLSLNDAPFDVLLIVEDTTAPTATSVSVVINIGEPVEAEDFVTDINDASPITSIVFAVEPDVLSHREQLVEVIVTDLHGNIATFTSSLTIILDDVPPIFEGIELIESMVGKDVQYGHGVTALDSFGRELELSVDDSEVNIDEEGEYKAYYIAQDLTGQISTEEFTVLIISVDPEEVIKKADEVLDEILEDDMTTAEEIRAIFTYIRGFLTVNDSEEKPVSLYEAAHVAFDTKRGNSFNYSALAQVLLTRAEIPNMRIFRSSDHPAHVWNLVSPDGEFWYHFDSMPTRIREINDLMHMFTQTQAKEFAEKLADRGTDPMYYDFETEFYPDVIN